MAALYEDDRNWLERAGDWLYDHGVPDLGSFWSKSVVPALNPSTGQRVDLALPKALRYTMPNLYSKEDIQYDNLPVTTQAPVVQTPAAVSTSNVPKGSFASGYPTKTDSFSSGFTPSLPASLQYTKPGTIADSEWFKAPATATAASALTGPDMTEALRRRSYADATPAKRAYMSGQGSDNSFWGNMLNGFSNLAKTNPMAFITTPIDIWSAFANYRANKQVLGMYQDQLNLQREAYEKNEARNQRRFDMLEQARATSQL